jgi:hypothetical protein
MMSRLGPASHFGHAMSRPRRCAPEGVELTGPSQRGSTHSEQCAGTRHWVCRLLARHHLCTRRNRAGQPCRVPAMATGRRRCHGGKSTAPQPRPASNACVRRAPCTDNTATAAAVPKRCVQPRAPGAQCIRCSGQVDVLSNEPAASLIVHAEVLVRNAIALPRPEDHAGLPT